METLGYGMHLILDGLKADAQALAHETAVRETVLALARALEPRHAPDLVVLPGRDAWGGYSVAALLAESHLSLHTFPAAGALCASIFSRHGLDVQALTDILTEHCGVRRFESHLKNRGRTMAKDRSRRLRTVCGDRQYAALRLETPAVS